MGQIGTDNNLMGILCFAVGMFLFSAVDTMAKFLTTDFHPVQVAWGRQVGMFLGVLVLFAIRGPNLFRSAAPFLQIGRGVFAACSALLFIMAVSVVPLADVRTLIEKLKTQRGIIIDQTVIPGANHFFESHMEPLVTKVSSYLDGRRMRSCMPLHAPNEKPAIQQARDSGLSVCAQSRAAAASDNSPWP